MSKLFKVKIDRKYYLKTRDEIKEYMRAALEKEGALSKEELENFTEILIFLLSEEEE